MADNCINGHWEEGVCVCNKEYDVDFDYTNIKPEYCKNEIVTVVDLTIISETLLHLLAITVTVVVLTWSVLGVCSIYFTVVGLYRLENKAKSVENDCEEFKIKKSGYDDVVLMNAALWDPPENVFKQLNNDK